MHIDKKPSSVITVIDRIYHPIAQNIGASLFLRNGINTEIQFPAGFFINLIQITGNLVANALKFTSLYGVVDVVFTLNSDEGHNILNMTVTNTGKSISPDLVSAFNQGKKVAKFIGFDGEPSFGYRLDYVMQLVSKENGRIFMKSTKGSGTTFSLSFCLQKEYLNQRNEVYTIGKNSAILRNDS